MKKIVICGATGLVGEQLVKLLHKKSYPMILVGRDAKKIESLFSFKTDAISWNDLSNIDPSDVGTVLNLAGAGVSDQKWTDEYKKTLRSSRLKTTEQCVSFCKSNSDIRLINASAVSAYGFYEGDSLTFSEDDQHKRTGSNFLQILIDDWESSALKAKENGNDVVLLRTGIVLDKKAGGLPAMIKPFKFFFGGPVGSGKQIMSWISLEDLVLATFFIIQNREISGPVNTVSPGHCTNKDFASALGKALGKPSFIKSPAFLIRAMMGQMGQELVLTGQKVVPQKLLDHNFPFIDTNIDEFLKKHLI